MWATITKPFAWLFVWLYNLTGNYGAAILPSWPRARRA